MSTRAKTKKTKPTKKRREFWHKQFHTINVAPFDTQIGVAVNMSEAEVIEAVRQRLNKPSCPQTRDQQKLFLSDLCREIQRWDESLFAAGRLLCVGASYFILLRLDPDQFRRSMNFIVHEATHAVQYLLRDRRIPLQEETEEVHAYLVGWLTEEILHRIYD